MPRSCHVRDDTVYYARRHVKTPEDLLRDNAVMQSASDVKTYLANNKGKFFCKRCLAATLYGQTPGQIEQALRALRNQKPYRTGKVICHDCGQDRECIADS
jgi:hypothetical protein